MGRTALIAFFVFGPGPVSKGDVVVGDLGLLGEIVGSGGRTLIVA